MGVLHFRHAPHQGQPTGSLMSGTICSSGATKRVERGTDKSEVTNGWRLEGAYFRYVHQGQ
jgi:hypothetical protein